MGPVLNLNGLSDWIVATPFSVYLQNLKNMIQVMQSIHLLAIAVVLSSAAMIDLRMLGIISKDQPLTSMVRRFLPGTWVALVVLLISGGALIIAEPARSLTAFAFQLKVVLILAAVGLTLAQQRFVAVHAPRWDSSLTLPAYARVAAVVSLVLWMAIIACGRWIAYA